MPSLEELSAPSDWNPPEAFELLLSLLPFLFFDFSQIKSARKGHYFLSNLAKLLAVYLNCSLTFIMLPISS
jgi:hypothetical protein